MSVRIDERVGGIGELVRIGVMKNRSIDEVIRGIKVQFKVEVKRWNPATEKYGDWTPHYDSEEQQLEDLLTEDGRDLIHNASFMTGVQPAALTYYAICNPEVFTPDPTDTTLDTEITTPAGLARHEPTALVDGVQESFTHVAGEDTTTVVAAFKNDGVNPVTGIKGYGNFNAAGDGTLGTESEFASLDLGVNDILKLTVTLTLG